MGQELDDPFTAEPHDHQRCVDTALAAAATLCSRRGTQLTELRQRVLAIVWEGHAPVGAYAILERLAAERGRVAPPTVYRALDFLGREGLVHRIDTLNAFVGCRRPADPHRACFMICRRCNTVAEFHDDALDTALEQCGARAGFEVESSTIELAGTCARCRPV